MINALVCFVTAVGAGWSRSQEWLLCARVLWNWLHNARSDSAAQGDDGLAHRQRRALQNGRLRGYLEQLVRVGWRSRFHAA